MPLLEKEGWLRHQPLEQAQTGWSVTHSFEKCILKDGGVLTTPAPLRGATPPVPGGATTRFRPYSLHLRFGSSRSGTASRILGSGLTSISAVSPRIRCAVPAAAIIAALSVVRIGFGK